MKLAKGLAFENNQNRIDSNLMNFDEIGKGLAFENNQNLIDSNLMNFDEF